MQKAALGSLLRTSGNVHWTGYVRCSAATVQYRFFHASGAARRQSKPRVGVPGGYTPPDPQERLKQLKTGEKTAAVLATVSLLVGYFALKRGFSDMASKSASRRSKMESLQVELPVLVVAGPSGSGKSTLLKKLLQQYPDKFAFSVSHTTRRPRAGETTGKEYHFTTREDMQAAIDSGDFIEWAEYSSNLYGTSIKSVLDCQKQGKMCVLDIDMQGVESIKKTNLNALFVHIKPPSLEALERRLRARKTESEEAVQKRLAVAKQELQYAATPGVFDHVVINDRVDDAHEKMVAIVEKVIQAPKS